MTKDPKQDLNQSQRKQSHAIEGCIIVRDLNEQQQGSRMNLKANSKKKARYSFKLPTKLPSTLNENIISPELKKIIISIENQDIETILTSMQEIFKIGAPTWLPHPFVENINTFATKNIREGMCNFIFFVDEKGKHPWILAQCTSFVDAIFSKQFTGKHKLSTNDSAILTSAKKLFIQKNKIQINQFGNGKALFSGYRLDQTRPYHHFYDQLKWLLQIKTEQAINCEKSFFIPSNFKNQKNNKDKASQFSIFPAVVGSNQLGGKLDQYTEKMEEIVYKDSIKTRRTKAFFNRLNQYINRRVKISKTKSRELVLWFGISGQKRIWVEQEEFLPELVNQLKPWFNSFVFFIDGFTQYEDNHYVFVQGDKETPINQDLEIVNLINQRLSAYSNVSVFSLVGKTYREKIQRCQEADFFITNAGAGQLVPHRFCKKPGILHSNEKHCVFPMGINNTSVKLVDKLFVRDVGNLFAKSKKSNKSATGLISYSIDIQVVIDMVIDMLYLRKI